MSTTSADPTVGRIVHYVSYGTPGGEYQSVCRAAIVTEVDSNTSASAQVSVGLCVMNPTGLFLNQHVVQDEAQMAGGTWHWPERTDNRTLGEVLADPTDNRASWPACADHHPVQHRDGKEPWCKGCGRTAAGAEPRGRL